MSVVVCMGKPGEPIPEVCRRCNPEIYCCEFKRPKNCPLDDYDSWGRKKMPKKQSKNKKEEAES